MPTLRARPCVAAAHACVTQAGRPLPRGHLFIGRLRRCDPARLFYAIRERAPVVRYGPSLPVCQSEKSGPGPMGSRNLPGDLGQGTIAPSFELELPVENDHGMRSAAPFPDEASARFQAWFRRFCSPL